MKNQKQDLVSDKNTKFYITTLRFGCPFIVISSAVAISKNPIQFSQSILMILWLAWFFFIMPFGIFGTIQAREIVINQKTYMKAAKNLFIMIGLSIVMLIVFLAIGAIYMGVSSALAPTPYEDGRALGLKAANITHTREFAQLKQEFKVRRNQINQVDKKKAIEFTKGFTDGLNEANKIIRENNRKKIESRYGP